MRNFCILVVSLVVVGTEGVELGMGFLLFGVLKK